MARCPECGVTFRTMEDEPPDQCPACGHVDQAIMDEESYASLADEMNDDGVGPWNEADWDEQSVTEAKRYAQANNLRWPPGTGDYDRWYEKKHN